MVKNVPRFLSLFRVYLPRNGFQVFLPRGQKTACKRKHEIDPSPEWAKPKLFPQGEPLGKRVSVTATNILSVHLTVEKYDVSVERTTGTLSRAPRPPGKRENK